MSKQLQALRKCGEEAINHPVLPDGMNRGDIERLLMSVSARIGLSDADLKVLLISMAATRPSDWTDPDEEPVCFMMQTNLARETGKSTRAVRRAESRLEAMGLVDKRVADNGSRCRLILVDGSEFRQGLCFTPLIERAAELMSLRDRMQEDHQRGTQLRRMCSALKRNIKHRLMDLQPQHPEHEGLREVADAFLGWPTRYDAFRTLAALEDHFEDVQRVSRHVDEIARLQPNMSGPPDENVRPYIQDTTQDCFVSCNNNVDKSTGWNQPDNDTGADIGPDGPTSACLGKKNAGASEARKSKFLDRLTPERLFELASEEMQLYITQHQGNRHAPDQIDFIMASINRVTELGIHKSAYDSAVDQMGDFATALCILIIDQNRHHPDTPIHCPGGVLRAMTMRAKNANLNIVGSLIGIAERECNPGN